MQGRPLKVSDLIPLGLIPEGEIQKAGATVPSEWLPCFPADKASPWKVHFLPSSTATSLSMPHSWIGSLYPSLPESQAAEYAFVKAVDLKLFSGNVANPCTLFLNERFLYLIV